MGETTLVDISKRSWAEILTEEIVEEIKGEIMAREEAIPEKIMAEKGESTERILTEEEIWQRA